jgi:CubicO group peptidase (beta-lactamase class C family)
MAHGGFSKARLARMHQVLASHVEQGTVAGAITLLSRRGETIVDAIGVQDLTRKDPMRRDSIFRIASMTKPITAVAAMILVEECRLTLDEPLDRFLPELANRRVTCSRSAWEWACSCCRRGSSPSRRPWTIWC